MFFHAVKEAIKEFNDQFSLKEQTVLLIFLIHCYNSLVSTFFSGFLSKTNIFNSNKFNYITLSDSVLTCLKVKIAESFESSNFHYFQEEDIVRTHIQHTVSLGIWRCILPSKLQSLLGKPPLS